MTALMFKVASKTISVLSLIVTVFAVGVAAQENTAAASTFTPTTKETVSPQDELAGKVRTTLKNPSEFVANLAEFLNEYPYDERGYNSLSSLSGSLKNEKSPDAIRAFVNQLIKNTAQVPAPLKANVYRHSAGVLINNGFYADAEALLQAVADSLDEAEFVEFKKKQFDEAHTEAANKRRAKEVEEIIKKNPKLEQFYRESEKTPPQFNPKRAKNDFNGLKVNVFDLLGKALWEQGKSAAAETAYRNSYAIEPSKDSMLGIAKASEKNGNASEALKYATAAALTGKITPEEMDYFLAVYAKQNDGKPDGAEKYLDAEYLKTYRNPVKGEKYKKSANRSNRVVLAEFFTGAGCIPCIPFDYAFETVHKDYRAKDLALLVYHMHAPALDPLGNFSADFRVAYYDLIGAPGTFVDGVKFVEDEENKSGEAAANKTQKIYDSLVRQINSSLETPAQARLKLKVKREDKIVKVNVNADKLKNVSDDATLHVALVENETSYSGENAMRFHIMVVRALAGDNAKKIYGFKVDAAKANKFEYSFDVNEIVARNLRYYDEYSSRGGFKFKKNQSNPEHLSVAAFLQDNKTKKILQSSIVNLSK